MSSNNTTLYMMVGLPGSGKTSYASSEIKNARIHSSDAIRKELLGDERDQSKSHMIFAELHKRVFEDLKNGHDVVYDATNISYKGRKAFLDRVKALKIENLRTVCIFAATPYEHCLERNRERDRVVPEEVITRMYRTFDIPMKFEGWDEIRIVDDVRFSAIDLFRRLTKLEHDNPHHTLTVGQHMLTSSMILLDKYPKTASSMCVRKAMLLHDIGKEKTKVFTDSKGNPTEIAHYYRHENVGAYDSFSYTCDMMTEERLLVALLIRWHMYPFAIEKSETPKKTWQKLRNRVGEDVFHKIMVMHECDVAAH